MHALCGVRDLQTNTILDDVAVTNPSGETELSFTPSGSVHQKLFRVVIGLDRNKDGKLGNDEVDSDNLPQNQRLYVRAVSAQDYQDSLSYLQNRSWLLLPLSVSADFFDYFSGNGSGTGSVLTIDTSPVRFGRHLYNSIDSLLRNPKVKFGETAAGSNLETRGRLFANRPSRAPEGGIQSAKEHPLARRKTSSRHQKRILPPHQRRDAASDDGVRRTCLEAVENFWKYEQEETERTETSINRRMRRMRRMRRG